MVYDPKAVRARLVIKQVFDAYYSINYFMLSLERVYKVKLTQNGVNYDKISIVFETDDSGFLMVVDGKSVIKYHFEFKSSTCEILRVSFRQYEEELIDFMVRF